MGARPSSFKKGGGFLNNVDATIAGYRLTDEFLGHPFKPGTFVDAKGKKVQRPHSLYNEVAFRVDGADEDTLVPLKVSNKFDQWEISEDEKTMSPVEDGANLSSSAGAQIFIDSLCNPTEGGEGFPEGRFPEDEFNWEAMIGTRVRLVQRTDAERTQKFGKRKGKNGGEFDRQDLVVAQVYDLPSAGKGSAKTSAKATPAKGGKVAKPVVDANDGDTDVDIADIAGKALKRYLSAAADNVLPKSKLRMKVLTDKTFKTDVETRDAVVNFLADDDNLAGIDGIEYDSDEKNQPVSLAE